MERLDYEKILQENLTEGAFAMITNSEKDFADWIGRVKYQAKRCDELFKELKHYKDLEEQGLLLKLPCKVGDIVYALRYGEDEPFIIVETEIIEIRQNENGWFFILLISSPAYHFEDFGKTVFLTQAEAEEALKRMKREE